MRRDQVETWDRPPVRRPVEAACSGHDPHSAKRECATWGSECLQLERRSLCSAAEAAEPGAGALWGKRMGELRAARKRRKMG